VAPVNPKTRETEGKKERETSQSVKAKMLFAEGRNQRGIIKKETLSVKGLKVDL